MVKKLICKKAFDGVPDGEIYPKSFAEGDEVIGTELGAIAIKEKWADWKDVKDTSDTKPESEAPENK